MENTNFAEYTYDRVTYSFGTKLNLGNYESADFHISFSSDVKDGETCESAFNRVKAFVDSESRKAFKEIKERGNL
jgi:hypothetical protein